MKVARGRVTFLLLGAAPSCVLLGIGPRPVAASDAALLILATVLSILTGFIIAVIAMAGDAVLYPGSWRVASVHRRQILRALNRYTMLFYVYLLAILVTFLGALIGGSVPDLLHRWVKHIALCIGLMALVWSFGMPIVIREEHKRRLDEEVDRRRVADQAN